MCVCPVSVVETVIYTHPQPPEGARLGLVAMGVFGSTYTHQITHTHVDTHTDFIHLLRRKTPFLLDFVSGLLSSLALQI